MAVTIGAMRGRNSDIAMTDLVTPTKRPSRCSCRGNNKLLARNEPPPHSLNTIAPIRQARTMNRGQRAAANQQHRGLCCKIPASASPRRRRAGAGSQRRIRPRRQCRRLCLCPARIGRLHQPANPQAPPSSRPEALAIRGRHHAKGASEGSSGPPRITGGDCTATSPGSVRGCGWDRC
jgi:hypothetical protein